MAKILIVDDDEAMLGLYRVRLPRDWEIINTDHPEQALALALEHRPDAILLDLMMPKFSGLQLCQKFHSLSYTALTPIFVVSGQGGTQYKEECEKLGAKGYFQKPVDFSALRTALNNEIRNKQAERRAEVRIPMRVPIKLRGTNMNGEQFEESTATENVSASGFLCTANASLWQGASVEVFIQGEAQRFAGRAHVARTESPASAARRYGFRFQEVTTDWVVQPQKASN
jgi:DNA-binding response OmpR family regulator